MTGERCLEQLRSESLLRSGSAMKVGIPAKVRPRKWQRRSQMIAVSAQSENACNFPQNRVRRLWTGMKICSSQGFGNGCMWQGERRIAEVRSAPAGRVLEDSVGMDRPTEVGAELEIWLKKGAWHWPHDTGVTLEFRRWIAEQGIAWKQLQLPRLGKNNNAISSGSPSGLEATKLIARGMSN